jgi:general secretion pathway protein C
MNARHPERSKAAVRNKHGTRVMGPGQRIDNLTLLAVRATGAILRTADGIACYIPVYLPAEERRAAAPTARSARAQSPHGRPVAAKRADRDELARSVRELGPGRYVVTREALMRVLGNPQALAKTASVRPLVKDGRSVGMQLVRLRPDSPLRLLGLEKGDVLRHLNGHALSTPDGLLEALRMLRSGSGVSLGLLRKEAVLNVSVTIN